MALIKHNDLLAVSSAHQRVDGYVEVHLSSEDGTIIRLLADTDGGYFELTEEDE